MTDIGDSAFRGCARLASVNLPASVTRLGASAFAGCAGLRRLALDSASVATSWTLKSLLPAAYATLTDISLGAEVTAVSDGFFDGCLALMSGVGDWRSIGKQIGKKGLWTENGWALGYFGASAESVAIPDGITQVAAFAFKGETLLTGVTIPASVESVGADAFLGCAGLRKAVVESAVLASSRTLADVFPDALDVLADLTLGGEVTELADGFFDGFTALERVEMSVADLLATATLREILPDSHAGLKSLVVGEGVTSFADGFFDECDSLVEISLPSTLEDFGDSDVRAVGARAGKSGFWIENGWLLGYLGDAPASVGIPAEVKAIAPFAFACQHELVSVAFPASLVSVGVGAFRECTGLERIDLPDGVERIGDAAFQDCTFLQALSLPSGLKRLGDSAFANCTSLSGLVCAEGLVEIGEAAFSNCWRMVSLSLPASLETVGANAFHGCDRIEEATVPTHVKPIAELLPDVAVRLTDIAIAEGETVLVANAFAGCSALTRIALPPFLAEIPDGAFRDCESLMSVTIPEGVTVIGADAFRGTSLASVEIPSTVATIGTGAFAGLDLLTELTLPASLQSVGDGAFADCSRLASLVIPAGVTSLGANVFNGCAALKAVYFLSATAPTVAAETYAGTAEDLVSYVVKGSTGWDGLETSKALPQVWPEANGRAIAWWEPNVFEVTFLGNGGEPESQGVSETTGATYVMPSEPPVRVGATFAGWWTEPVNGGQVKVTTKVELTRPHTLYAHWRGHVYEIAFDLNGAAGDLPSLSMEYGEAKTLPSCTVRRRDFDFAGWALSPDADAADFADGAEVLNLTDEDGATVTLYAVWRERKWTAADCLNAPGLTFVSTNDAAWFADGRTCHDGVASMRSGVLGTAPEGETVRSTLKTSVRGNGSLSFWWKVICEPSDPQTGDLYDYLELTVDGVRPEGVAPISGATNDWAFVTVRIEGGAAAHEVCWSFVKDDWDEAAFADVAWVDEVTWTPDPVTLTFAANGATGGDAPEEIVSACGETVTLPGASSLVCEGCSFVGWSDGERTYAAGAAFVVGAADVAFTAVWREMSLGDVLNAPTLAFATDGVAAWTFDAAVSHDGVASLRSGAVAAGQTSWVETSVTNAGTLAFWWKADGLLYRGKPANYMEVSVDGVAVTNATVTDWASVSVEVVGSGAHTVRWTYVQTRTQTEGEACAWLDEVTWTPAAPVAPTVDGDDGASVTGDAETGFVVTPSEDATAVVVTIPSGVDAAKVTVVVAPETKRVTPNGATVRVLRGEADITDFLDIPPADASGVIDLNAATVKEEIAKAVLSIEEGAEINLSSENPTLTTAETKPGLKYQLYECVTLSDLKAGDSTVGDGSPWTPKITEKGGFSGFYTIQVTK